MDKTSVQKKGQHIINFSLPMSYTVTMLCWAYIINDELYESMGLEEKIRQEIRWASEYFIKCHREKGVYFFQAMDGSLKYSFKEAAELTDFINYSLRLDEKNPCTIIAAEPAAALAASSRAFLEIDQDFSQLCLKHAKDLMELAESSVHNSKQMSIGKIKGYEDKFLWACLWIFIASGEQHYLQKALSYCTKEDMETEHMKVAMEEWGTNSKDYETELTELLGRFADGGVFEKMFNEWKIRHKRYNKNNTADDNGASETADKTRILRMVKPRDNVEYLVGKQSIDVVAEIRNNEEAIKTVEFYANGVKFGETDRNHRNLYESSYVIPTSQDNSEIEVKLRAKAVLENGNTVKSDSITVYANVTDVTRDNRIKRKKSETQNKSLEKDKNKENQIPFPFHNAPLPVSIKKSEEVLQKEEVKEQTNAAEMEQRKEQESVVKDEAKMKEDTKSIEEEKKFDEQTLRTKSVPIEMGNSIANSQERNLSFWEPVVGQPVQSVSMPRTGTQQNSESRYTSNYANTDSYRSQTFISPVPDKLYQEKIKVELICEESEQHDILCAMVKLKNVSNKSYDLSKLKVRYYFSKSRNNPTCKIDQAGLRTGKAPFYADMTYAIDCQSHKSGSFIAGADYYVEAGFKFNQLFGQEHMLNIQFRLQSASVNEYFFVNDYSFDKANKVVILYDEDVIEGMLP